jgi:hypothetical protein
MSMDQGVETETYLDESRLVIADECKQQNIQAKYDQIAD